MKLLSAFVALLITLINVLGATMLSFPSDNTAYAEEFSGLIYAKAEVKDAYVCTEPSIEYAVFAIPYTYCVQILSESGDWYRVKYAEDTGIYRAIYGYCLKSCLTLLSEVPKTTYLYKTITVTYTADAPSTSLPILGEITISAAYYGIYYQGPAAYSYVLYDGSFGYISGANDDYPLNVSTEQPPSNSGNETESPINVQLIVGVGLTVLAAAALLMLFFGNRKKPFTPTRD